MNLKAALRYAFGLALVLVAASVSAHAVGGFPAPEVGVSEIGSAVSLLTGGCLVLSSRFRGKK